MALYPVDRSALTSEDASNALAAAIGNEALARDVVASVAAALERDDVVLGGPSVAAVIGETMDAVVADVERDERAALLRRLLRYGPKDEDEPQEPGDDECAPRQNPDEHAAEGAAAQEDRPGHPERLSDEECDRCVEFIHSHMVNRFKGDLAELLALRPVLELLDRLRSDRAVDERTVVYWGATIGGLLLEGSDDADASEPAGPERKAADGLVVEPGGAGGADAWETIRVRAIVEVKSMPVSARRLRRQLASHETRLGSGLRLGDRVWAPSRIRTGGAARAQDPAREAAGAPVPGAPAPPDTGQSAVLRIVVTPAAWKLSRMWRRVPGSEARAIEAYESTAPALPPPDGDQVREAGENLWHATLAWSKEALEAAAYALTFSYIAEIGRTAFEQPGVPRELDGMTPGEAGQNNIKAMLYALILRPITNRHRLIATKLFNIYSFGYPLAADSRGMLWPEDFPAERPGEWRPAPKLGPSRFPMMFEFNFRRDMRGWRVGFADYPVADADIYQLVGEHRPLPPELGLRGSGLYVSGTNRSDDLVMFLVRRVTGLVPETTYDVAFKVGFATNAPSGCIGSGGAPGEAVYVKAGATVREPEVRVVDGYARLAIDIGNQANGGKDAVVLGTVANSSRDCHAPPWEMKILMRQPGEFTVTTGKRGALWLFVGTDSGYESTTSLFYRCVRVAFIPR